MNTENKANDLTKLEYALIHSTWQPSKEDIESTVRMEKFRNPYNDYGKPRLHSYQEIVNLLRIKHFTELLNNIK